MNPTVYLTGVEIWDGLMFGPTAFLGAAIFLAIAFIVTAKIKVAGIVFIPLCFFLGYEYLSTIAEDNVHMWAGIMVCFGAVVELLIMIKGREE